MTNRSNTLQPHTAQEKGASRLLANLAVETLSGLEIIRPDECRENRLRGQISQLSDEVARHLSSMNISDVTLRGSIEKLRSARDACMPALDYRDFFHASCGEEPLTRDAVKVVPSTAREGWFTVEIDGTPFTEVSSREGAEAEITDLLEASAEPSEDQKPGSDQFPSEVTDSVLFGLVALLLIDSAVVRLDSGDCAVAAAELMHAVEARGAMLYPHHARLWRQAAARAGGLAAHQKYENYKKTVIEKWNAGNFGGNKAEAARWATQVQRWPVNPDVVMRWIRNHEKQGP